MADTDYRPIIGAPLLITVMQRSYTPPYDFLPVRLSVHPPLPYWFLIRKQVVEQPEWAWTFLRTWVITLPISS